MDEQNKPATKLCKYCKTEIPKGAKVCPNCKKRQSPSGCLIAVLVSVALVVVLGIAGSSGGSKSAPPTPTQSTAPDTAALAATDAAPAETAAPTPEKASYAVGEPAESSGVTVTLVSADVSTGSGYNVPTDGNVFVLMEFEIENSSSADITVSSLVSFEAYCDDYSVNTSYTAQIFDSSKSGLDGSVAAGKKMNGVIGYEVPADFKTLEVTFTPSFWASKGVVFTVQNG